MEVLIPAAIIRVVAALAFVAMGGLVWKESIRSGHAMVDGGRECGCKDAPPPAPGQHRPWNWQAFGTTLTLLFLAELGDKTQLAMLGLTSQQGVPWAVFASGALALTLVTALGVIGGQQLCRLIPERTLLRISAATFLLMGALMGLGIL